MMRPVRFVMGQCSRVNVPKQQVCNVKVELHNLRTGSQPILMLADLESLLPDLQCRR